MIEFNKLYRLPYVSKRMYIIKRICHQRSVDLEYLFGLFNLYNKRNGGKWFWQKASFTGPLKKAFDGFDSTVDRIVKDLKNTDEKKTTEQIIAAAQDLDKLMTGMELNCEVNRESDASFIRGHLDNNLRILINDSLKKIGMDTD